MDYEIDSDSDSDSDGYNYNYNNNTNNWNTLTGDKINQQTDRHNNSFLDMINKKLESLENIERSNIVERKNDSFLDLYVKIKYLNLEREFKPLHRSPLTKTRTNNWHNERNSVIENLHINSSWKDDRELKATKRPITIAYKDNKKDFDERKDYSHVVQKMIEVEKERNSIETKQKKKLDIIDEDREKGMLKKGIVKRW